MSSEEKAKLYQRLSDIDGSLARVLLILESDRRTNSQGLVEEVRNLKARIEEMEVRDRIRKSQIATYGALGSGFALALGWLIKQVAIFFIK